MPFLRVQLMLSRAVPRVCNEASVDLGKKRPCSEGVVHSGARTPGELCRHPQLLQNRAAPQGGQAGLGRSWRGGSKEGQGQIPGQSVSPEVSLFSGGGRKRGPVLAPGASGSEFRVLEEGEKLEASLINKYLF